MGLLLTPPGLPSLLAGILNLRGRAIPIVRLDRLFGNPESEPGLYTPLIILRNADRPLGILAEALIEVVSLPAESAAGTDPSHILNGCATAVVEAGKRAVHLLSAERILFENERCVLAELQTTAQARMAAMGAF